MAANDFLLAYHACLDSKVELSPVSIEPNGVNMFE